MRLADYAYELPEELIAQEPSADRSSSRLMTVDRSSGRIGEKKFAEIGELLQQGDLLVVNDTRVIPARLLGFKESGGRVELFLIRKQDSAQETWECLIRASKRPRVGTRILLNHGMVATVEGRGSGESWLVSFDPDEGFSEWLEQSGSVPLPPYIRRAVTEIDRERYQTVFSRVGGAVAAPTAGLHFTTELLDELCRRGVRIVPITLHVGLGTFLPIRVTDLSEHRMHREYWAIPKSTAAAINKQKDGQGRVIAVGTTVVRGLEHAAGPDGVVRAGEGETDIFIRPGYNFRVVDALVTNFHLPESTLLMLVAAFTGKELMFKAYAEAVARRFRFYSYGDAMFIS